MKTKILYIYFLILTAMEEMEKNIYYSNTLYYTNPFKIISFMVFKDYKEDSL